MESAIRGTGVNRDTEAQVDASTKAIRMSLRPIDWTLDAQPGVGGHYYVEAASGALTGVGANGVIFSFQWRDPKLVAILKRLSLWYYITTAYTAAQMNDFELIFATNFTAAHTGGNALVAAPKRRSLMAPSSAVTDLRMASTAALGGGTLTLDSQGMRAVADGPPNVAIPTATLAVPRQELLLYDNKEMGVHPKVMGKDEGFVVRAITAMGAAGVIKAYLAAEWCESQVY